MGVSITPFFFVNIEKPVIWLVVSNKVKWLNDKKIVGDG